MRTWVPVVFGLAFAACTFDSSALALDDDPVGGTGPDAGEAGEDVPPASIPPAVPLDSTTAIVRYFIDDAAFFPNPAEAKDAIGDPELNLGLTDSTQNAVFVSVDDHRGISFGANNGDARLSVAVQDTKIRQALDASRTGTIELVVDVSQVVSQGSRLSHIGDGFDPGIFSLRASSTSTLDFYFNNFHAASWAVDFASSGRVVLHLVVDTTEESAASRVRMYLNGQLQISAPVFLPLRNQRISISNAAGQHFVLGNREIGDRNFAGTFYYAAMYSGALNAEIVAHNASVLQATDDSAQIVGQ